MLSATCDASKTQPLNHVVDEHVMFRGEVITHDEALHPYPLRDERQRGIGQSIRPLVRCGAVMACDKAADRNRCKDVQAQLDRAENRSAYILELDVDAVRHRVASICE